MRIIIFILFKPLYKIREMIKNLLSMENSINHMTTEEPHFDFISQMRIYLFIFMNTLKNIRSHWSISKFKFIKCLLCDLKFISLIKIFNRHLLNNSPSFSVSVFIQVMGFHILFLELGNIFSKVSCRDALFPFIYINVCFSKALWDFPIF